MKNNKGLNLKGWKLYLTIVLLDLIFGFAWYYVEFPALNIHNIEFFLILIVLITADAILIALSHVGSFFGKKITGKKLIKKIGRDAVTVLVIDAAIILVVVIGSICGMTILRSRSYASLLKVENRDFAEDIPESESVTNIALMDTESARIFGNREIGSLSEVVSQYEVEDDYNQINLNGVPRKVAVLKYASFFKWLKNRSNGVPGYVEVDPVNADADYKTVAKGLRYVPSGYFNDNLMRHVQFQYPTKIIDGYYFEVDDEGNPYFVCPCVSARVGLFDGMDVVGAILCDPVTGKSQYYKVDEIPSWIDRVYDGELCARKYDWKGLYSKGYLNSIISQTGCTKTTDDYGYVALDDDVWIYTGVTSLNSDQSNVGFVMINQRTSEARYYKVSGAEEYSAMKSAEGTVQEKNYEASFPCLINVDGQPTYIMVLKDSGGLVKMYAMVNVEQYNIVATGTSQADVFAKYRKQIKKDGKGTDHAEQADKTMTITLADIQYIVSDGETTVYLKDTDGNVYKQPFADNESLITFNAGDVVEVTVNDPEDEIMLLTDVTLVSHAQPESTTATTETAEGSDNTIE